MSCFDLTGTIMCCSRSGIEGSMVYGACALLAATKKLFDVTLV